ncbi:hypothetical protein BW723_16540 [Polaribacter reichenbachii]|uniref:Peptidase S74 domain-containing protein n=1 Tax=Polaribacter reichenbachii TaxID=996801 RepID=A0A1B8TRJ4_9FLAO|nr:hypothetical protein [Polaribacter reichenbachii]APZ47805.1 hypothetical protein BW723_16540 [Polaribacter reichenbachii]AUC18440.1 hypothetical protein BTO17_06960 [Polaribacter reichenbachii]OBY62209.1 hypothetical protein LPB301_15105 [Polaribacter reichenbachii]
MKKRILLIALIAMNFGIHSQTKIGFDINDAFDVSGNSVAHYGMSRISGTGYHYVGLSGYFGLNFYTQGKERIKILGNGNIGIGIAAPNAKLEVSDELRVRLATNYVDKNVVRIIPLNYSGITGAMNWSIRGTYQYSNGVGINAIGGDLDIIKSWNRNTILATKSDGTSLGNVGIGTINPDMKLTVNGSVHAKEVKIDLNIPAPDYVFKKSYRLIDLEELENFIKENNHLPEIPSAKEFEKNGIMLAKMDMDLLKKIEELTLYTIAQEKKIEKVEKENESLKFLLKKVVELQKRLEKLEKE